MTLTPSLNYWEYPSDRYYYGWYGAPAPHAVTDGEMKGNVVDRLRVNPHTKDHELQVDVKNGVVVLTGEVSSSVAKRAAGDDCWDTTGVIDVSNQLSVAARS
jgi:osmotically-inducible protein OsmY